MVVEKIVILILFQFKFWATVKKLILKPLDGHDKIELILVMLVVPFVMNVSNPHVLCFPLFSRHHDLLWI